PPHAGEVDTCDALDAGPGAALPVEDGASAAHRPHVARPAPPDAAEPVRRAARDARPGAAVPVEDGASVAYRPDVARPAPPDAVACGLPAGDVFAVPRDGDARRAETIAGLERRGVITAAAAA